MKKNSENPTKDRMIHIRLTSRAHQQLRVRAAQEDTTIQKLVEDLILTNLANQKTKGVQ